VTESWKKGRVKLIGGTSPDDERPEQAAALLDPDAAQRQALQVLTLAQRTAEEHVAGAHHEADKIQAAARAKAEQIVRDAEAHADTVRQEADKALSEARATAERIARDAQAHADNARRDADKIVSDARAQAGEIAKDAQANADELKRQAQQRYDDIVGSLATKRAALQQQIEALEQFDREYRARLTTFMQAQLRSLWVDEPQVGAELEQSDAATTTGSRSAHRSDSTPTTPSVPTQQRRSEATAGSRPAGTGHSRRA
jgi:cell division septum initiation protein DivIVA